MKKINIYTTIIMVTLSLLFASCIGFNKEIIKGNGELTTKRIDISNFSEIEIETYVELNYSQTANSGNLEFTVDGNLWDYYDIYTKNNVLSIKLKDEYKKSVHLKPTQSLLAVSSEQLEKISIVGSSNVNFCTDFISKKLDIGLAGSGNIYANKYSVNVEDCKIDIAGSGDVYLSGAIQKTHYTIAGSGDLKALDCEMAQLYISIAGSSDVEATVTEKLSVEIAGSGKVKYKGNPEIVKQDVAGSGKVIKL